MLFVLLMLAHSWYPRDCCGERDCHPIAAVKVQVTASNYIVYDGGILFTIPIEKAQPSPDEQYHICINQSTGFKNVTCFFSPRGTT